MSWLFGVIGPAVSGGTIARCRSIHTEPREVFQREGGYYLAVGGLSATCLTARASGTQDAQGAFAVALGCLYSKDDSGRKLLTQEAWAQIAFDARAVNALEGHFVLLRCVDGSFELETDRLGLRTLYWAETPEGTVISSRLDWVSRLIGAPRISFEKFASRWILYNPLTYDAPLEGVQRLGPSGELRIGPSGTRHRFSYYSPVRRENVSVDDLTEKLRAAMTSRMPEGMEVSLGLSGGLDSRVLLAVLLHSKPAGAINVHTMGSTLDPDVRISRRIAEAEGLTQRLFDLPLPSFSEAMARCTEYVAQTNLTEAASAALRLQNYTMLDPERFILSDGAFGEVARRQYLNRLGFKGRRVIERNDIDAVCQGIGYRRANFFTEEIEARMRSGVKDEIGRALAAMPPVDAIGLGDYLDLLTARTRVPNFTCDEQARLDGLIINDMPFTEGAVFDDIFSIPVKLRNKGTLLREIIRRECARLEKYPLVKNNTTHPYFLSTQPSRVWTAAKNKLGYRYHDTTVDAFLGLVKECVLDTLHSRETADYAPYRYDALKKMVHEYYAGRRALASQVNWWFSFDLWRRMIERDTA
jgi:hypothetical protein